MGCDTIFLLASTRTRMSEAVEAISDAAKVEGLACVAIRLALTLLILCTHCVYIYIYDFI